MAGATCRSSTSATATARECEPFRTSRTAPSSRSRRESRGTARRSSRRRRSQPVMRGLVQAMKAYEELAVAAATTGDRGIALKALLANPLVARWSIAEPLLDALLEANRAHLPRFFPAAAAADAARDPPSAVAPSFAPRDVAPGQSGARLCGPAWGHRRDAAVHAALLPIARVQPGRGRLDPRPRAPGRASRVAELGRALGSTAWLTARPRGRGGNRTCRRRPARALDNDLRRHRRSGAAGRRHRGAVADRRREGPRSRWREPFGVRTAARLGLAVVHRHCARDRRGGRCMGASNARSPSSRRCSCCRRSSGLRCVPAERPPFPDRRSAASGRGSAVRAARHGHVPARLVPDLARDVSDPDIHADPLRGARRGCERRRARRGHRRGDRGADHASLPDARGTVRVGPGCSSPDRR